MEQVWKLVHDICWPSSAYSGQNIPYAFHFLFQQGFCFGYGSSPCKGTPQTRRRCTNVSCVLGSRSAYACSCHEHPLWQSSNLRTTQPLGKQCNKILWSLSGKAFNCSMCMVYDCELFLLQCDKSNPGQLDSYDLSSGHFSRWLKLHPSQLRLQKLLSGGSMVSSKIQTHALFKRSVNLFRYDSTPHVSVLATLCLYHPTV